MTASNTLRRHRSVDHAFSVALDVWVAAGLRCAVFLATTAHMAEAGINVWTSYGPVVGDVYALAIDPATPTTLYAGTDRGLFKSTDGARTWAVTSADCGGVDTHVRAVTIDPATRRGLRAGRLRRDGALTNARVAGAARREAQPHGTRQSGARCLPL